MMPGNASKWKAPGPNRALSGRKPLPRCKSWALIFPAIGQSMSMNFEGQQFDYVMTVCDNAKESCPVFFGAAKKLHHSFDDPPPASEGTEEERMAIFRRVRDELRAYLADFPRQAEPARFTFANVDIRRQPRGRFMVTSEQSIKASAQPIKTGFASAPGSVSAARSTRSSARGRGCRSTPTATMPRRP